MIHVVVALTLLVATWLAAPAVGDNAPDRVCSVQNMTDVQGIAQLVQSVRSHGGDSSNVNIRVAPEGRGAFATKNISSGDVLFRLPRSTIFSPHLTSKTSVFEPSECQVILKHPNGQISTAFLLYIETAKQYSEFRPYFDTLPKEIPLNIFSFTDEEVELCHGISDIQSGSRAAQQLIMESYGNFSRCVDLVRETLVDIGVDLQKLTIEHVRWSLAVVKSRSIGVFFPDDSGGRSLLPLVDMMNHQPCQQGGAFLHWEVYDTHISIRAPQNYTEGDQIYECYGAHGNMALLAAFGFTFLGCGDHDKVDLKLPLGDGNISVSLGSEEITPIAVLQAWNVTASEAGRKDKSKGLRFRDFNAMLLRAIQAHMEFSTVPTGSVQHTNIGSYSTRTSQMAESCNRIRACNSQSLTKAEASIALISANVEEMYARCVCEGRENFLPFDDCRAICETF
jgi:hypothetical protein